MPCGDTFAFWTGVYGGRTVADAYLLVDRFDNTTFGPTVTAASQPHPDLAVTFANQLASGPHHAGFTLGVDWSSGVTRPSGSFASTLTVDYPGGSDWPAGQVSRDITIQLDGEPSHALINKLSYDARFGVDDGSLPQIVPPAASGEALATLADGSRPRLVLLAIAGTSVHGSTVVQGSDEPSLESPKVYRNFGSAWGKTTAQAPYDAVLEVAPGGEVELWVEAAGEHRRVTDVAFRVHRCPRFEHLTQDAPPGECSAAPVDSDPVTGTLTVALNPPDGQRGYVGIELTRAPVAPGGYYLAVRSVGATPYRVRPAAHLTQRCPADADPAGFSRPAMLPKGA